MIMKCPHCKEIRRMNFICPHCRRIVKDESDERTIEDLLDNEGWK
jgi:ribosomal protein L32